jgi:hypothetical protein
VSASDGSALDEFLAAGDTRATAQPGKPSDLDGAIAEVLRARDTSEMVAALRALAAAAERLAAALEGGS